MARGRMISSTLARSKKIREVADPARFIYVLILVSADRDGLVPGDPGDLFLSAEAGLLYDLGTFSAAVADLESAGLLVRVRDIHGEEVLHLAGFHKQQPELRYEREGFSRWQLDTNVRERLSLPEKDETRYATRRKSGPSPDLVRTQSGPSPPEVEVEDEVEEEERAARARVATGGPESVDNFRLIDPPLVGAQFSLSEESTSRIRSAYVLAFEKLGRAVPGFKPRELKAAAIAAQAGTCSSWPSQDELVAEMLRTIRGAESKGLPTDLEFILNHVGEEWTARGNGQPAKRALDIYDAADRENAQRAAAFARDLAEEKYDGPSAAECIAELKAKIGKRIPT